MDHEPPDAPLAESRQIIARLLHRRRPANSSAEEDPYDETE